MTSFHYENGDFRLTIKGKSDPVCDKELVENFFYRKNVEEVIIIKIKFSAYSQSAQFSSLSVFINVQFIQRILPVLKFFLKVAVTEDFNIYRHRFII